MNRGIQAVFLASGLVLGAAAPADAGLRVVATVPDLAAIAKEIGGDRVRVQALALHTQDPHFVDARPNLALGLARADLLLLVGLELEVGWLPTLLTGSRNGAIQRGGRGYLDCSEHVHLLEQPRQRPDRSMGDVHPGGNPHYLFDPREAVIVARAIGERMAALDPSNAAAYRTGAAAFVRRLEEARSGWERRMAKVRGAKVIAFHKSFPYLADWLGLRVVEHIEPRPGIPPNPAHVSRVLRVAREEGVRLILQESFYPDTTAKLIAARTDSKLVRLPGGTDFEGGQRYADFIASLLSRIERGLGG